MTEQNLGMSDGITVMETWPPNINEIRAALGPVPKNAVFAWGDVIFNPSGEKILEPLRIHELTHTAQQGKDIAGWWKLYLEDKDFRFTQELEAFSNEYNCYRTIHKNREAAFRCLHSCAERLSAKHYGSMVSMSEAFKLIKEHADSGYSKRK